MTRFGWMGAAIARAAWRKSVLNPILSSASNANACGLLKTEAEEIKEVEEVEGNCRRIGPWRVERGKLRKKRACNRGAVNERVSPRRKKVLSETDLGPGVIATGRREKMVRFWSRYQGHERDQEGEAGQGKDRLAPKEERFPSLCRDVSHRTMHYADLMCLASGWVEL